MGSLVSKLSTGTLDKNIVVFKTASMICLEKIADRQWSIRWMLTPEILNSKG